MTIRDPDPTTPCPCSVRHQPAPLNLEVHHIQPTYLGGPDTPDNRVPICPTAHTNVHEILATFMRDGLLTWTQVGDRYDTPVSRYAYGLAYVGYQRWAAAQASA
jgi:hypothetical protein